MTAYQKLVLSLARMNCFNFHRYLQEYQPLGTAGGLYHFRDQIISSDVSAILVIHADIFCILPLQEMIELYKKKNQASNNGCHIVLGTHSNKVCQKRLCKYVLKIKQKPS